MRRAAFVLLLPFVCGAPVIGGQESRQSTYTITRNGQLVPGTVDKNKRQAQPLTNDSILRLVRAKLGEDTIIDIVNTQPGKYSLGTDDIIALKRAGVSEKIIAAILNKSFSLPAATTPSSPPAPVLPNPSSPSLTTRALSVESGDPPIPQRHGLYYQDSNGLVAIEGQVISFARSGSLLASAATFGIKSRKINVQLLEGKAVHITGTRPVFHYRAAQGTESAGGSAGDLVLVRMIVSGKRRQFEVGAGGAWRASSGISIRSQLPITRRQTEPGLYELTPDDLLKPGQYGLYLFRGYDLPGYVYDFSVE